MIMKVEKGKQIKRRATICCRGWPVVSGRCSGCVGIRKEIIIKRGDMYE